MYMGHSIHKLQNDAIPLILKIQKKQNYNFCMEFNFKHTYNFLDNDIITVHYFLHAVRYEMISMAMSPDITFTSDITVP